MKKSTACVIGILVQTLAGTASAASVIDFEDSNISHSALGFYVENVGEVTGYTGIVAGYTAAGNWGIEGTNGSSFLALWGAWNGGTGGYSGSGDTLYTHLIFTEANTTTLKNVNVSIDVLLASGNYSGNSFTFYGFDSSGTLVSTQTLTFSSVTVNSYAEYMATLTFTGVAEIRFSNNMPFGLDNIVITAVPEPSALAFALSGVAGGLLLSRRRAAGR